MRFYQMHKRENNMIHLIHLVGLGKDNQDMGKEEMDKNIIINLMERTHLKI